MKKKKVFWNWMPKFPVFLQVHWRCCEILRRRGPSGLGAHSLKEHHLQRPQAREPPHQRNWPCQGHRLWLRQEDWPEDVDCVWHARIPGSRDHSEQRVFFFCSHFSFLKNLNINNNKFLKKNKGTERRLIGGHSEFSFTRCLLDILPSLTTTHMKSMRKSSHARFLSKFLPFFDFFICRSNVFVPRRSATRTSWSPQPKISFLSCYKPTWRSASATWKTELMISRTTNGSPAWIGRPWRSSTPLPPSFPLLAELMIPPTSRSTMRTQMFSPRRVMSIHTKMFSRSGEQLPFPLCLLLKSPVLQSLSPSLSLCLLGRKDERKKSWKSRKSRKSLLAATISPPPFFAGSPSDFTLWQTGNPIKKRTERKSQ